MRCRPTVNDPFVSTKVDVLFSCRLLPLPDAETLALPLLEPFSVRLPPVPLFDPDVIVPGSDMLPPLLSVALAEGV